MDADLLAEQIEHYAFLDELARLEEAIFWKLRNMDFPHAKVAWDDIAVYGTEPIFAGLLFEKIANETAK